MYGAILGDIVGSPFEFDRGEKSKQFTLFSDGATYTDDTVMTVAVAKALLEAGKDADVAVIRSNVIEEMRHWGKRYPGAGYGGSFAVWLKSKTPRPYGSYGNGSAMRVSAAGWLYDTMERTREVARATAEVTHNHPEGIKGAEAVAAVIFLARNGEMKEAIKEYVEKEFGYDLDRTLDEIRPAYRHVESCQETVPEAIIAFMEGTDFEDVVRNAVSLGGDCDTLTDIAAAMAEAFYGIPAVLRAEVRDRVEEDMLEVLDAFDSAMGRPDDTDTFLIGNERIKEAIERLEYDDSREAFINILEVIRERMLSDGHFLMPARAHFDFGEMIDIEKVKIGDTFTNEEPLSFEFCTLESQDGKHWMAVFTDDEEYRKGESADTVMSQFIDWILEAALNNESVAGIVLNPWDKSITLTKELIALLLGVGED